MPRRAKPIPTTGENPLLMTLRTKTYIPGSYVARLARLGVFLKKFEKETVLMNLCNVNGKVPDLKRHQPYPKKSKVNKHP